MSDAASDAPPTPTARPANRAGGAGPPRRVRFTLMAVGVATLVIVVIFGLRWWFHGRFVEYTDDAYVRADAVTVAPRVSGYVAELYVGDNQPVVAGQLLAAIDANSYDAALAQQQAAVAARQADLADAQAQIEQQQAAIEGDRAQLAGAQADAAFAASEAKRYQHLSAEGVETAERAAQARNQRDQAAATQRADAATLRAAQRQLDAMRSRLGAAAAQLESAQAALRSANIDLGDTRIRASIAGRIGDRTVRLGQFVQPGTRLMSVVPVDQAYLVANFKETQIGRIHIGQKATVALDALDGRTIDAVVESFSPGTGAQFALLPPENATGNFTKIVQRVPVRLRLIVPPELKDHLLPGLSATVSIDTTQPREPGP